MMTSSKALASILIILAVGLLAFLVFRLLGFPSSDSNLGAAFAPTPSAATSAPILPSQSEKWENITLEQIRFGEPRRLDVSSGNLQIMEWVDNDRLLILRGLNPPFIKAIETVDIRTGQVRRFDEGRIFGRPTWLEIEEAVSYLWLAASPELQAEIVWWRVRVKKWDNLTVPQIWQSLLTENR